MEYKNLQFIKHLKKRVKEIESEINNTQNIREREELFYDLGRIEGIIYIIKTLKK
jgi:hypothetical protein